MRTHLIAALSLSLFAVACTDMATDEDGSAERPVVGLGIGAHVPTNFKLTQPDALRQCRPHEHLASSQELVHALGHCVEHGTGYNCTPLDNDAWGEIKGLDFDGVWTTTVCAQPDHSPGFFVANLDSGEITCQPATAAAQPLCLN